MGLSCSIYHVATKTLTKKPFGAALYCQEIQTSTCTCAFLTWTHHNWIHFLIVDSFACNSEFLLQPDHGILESEVQAREQMSTWAKTLAKIWRNICCNCRCLAEGPEASKCSKEKPPTNDRFPPRVHAWSFPLEETVRTRPGQQLQLKQTSDATIFIALVLSRFCLPQWKRHFRCGI